MINRHYGKKSFDEKPGMDCLNPVSMIMSTRMVWLNENDSLEIAITLFERCQMECAPVKNDSGQFLGVVQKSDLICRELFQAIAKNSLRGISVKDIMKPLSALMIEERASIKAAAQLMLSQQSQQVFVKDPSGNLVGVITMDDIVKTALDLEDTEAAQPSVARELLRQSMQTSKAELS